MTDLRRMIQQLADQGHENYSMPGKVVSVNERERTCVVSPSNGSAQRFGVRLQAGIKGTKGICPIPKVGSDVMITFMNKATGYVALCTEVDKVIIDCDNIVFNEGNNGGLIIVSELLKKINRLEERMLTHQHISPAGPTTPDSATTNQPFQPTTIDEITNNKIKH